MKVLKNNFNGTDIEKDVKQVEPYPRKLTCEQCGSELEYEKSDLKMGVLGCMHLKCPCCNYDNMIEENENTITLTPDNVQFPVHFFHTSKDNGAIEACNNDEVQKCIRQAIKYFRENKDEYGWHIEYGNLYVAVYRYGGDEDYYVVVSNNFYSTYIPFESEDC